MGNLALHTMVPVAVLFLVYKAVLQSIYEYMYSYSYIPWYD